MLELSIPVWTGVCNANGKQILGLGNDIYQIAVAIVEGVAGNAARVSFNAAEDNRKKAHNIDGITVLFPSLREGVVLKEGVVTEIVTPTLITRHSQMAGCRPSLLRKALIGYFRPYIHEYLNNDETYEDVLVIYLRGGDALDEWAQNAWRPSPLGYDFYRDVIEKSELSKILIVTTPPENGKMHPLVHKIQQEHDAQLQHGSIIEDYSVLANCTNLVLDFSTFGYTAALMNTNLKKVFLSKYTDKQGRPLLADIRDDVGFTMPTIENCDVYIYDYPAYVIK